MRGIVVLMAALGAVGMFSASAVASGPSEGFRGTCNALGGSLRVIGEGGNAIYVCESVTGVEEQPALNGFRLVCYRAMNAAEPPAPWHTWRTRVFPQIDVVTCEAA